MSSLVNKLTTLFEVETNNRETHVDDIHSFGWKSKKKQPMENTKQNSSQENKNLKR